MKEDLNEFFSLIGKAKKEKEDEFRSLVGEINIDSIFSTVKTSLEEDKKKKEKKLKEEKKKKEKEAKQVKALEAWLYSNTTTEEKKEESKIEIEDLNGNVNFEVVDLIKPKPIGAAVNEEVVEEEVVEEEIDDTIDHALRILETIKSKEEVQENLGDPEILKIRRELEYLKNLVNAQGGGGEVRLEFLDDIDRTSAKVDGKFLKYESSLGKWIGADATGGGGSGDYASVAGIATYAITAGIATYAITAGVSTYSISAGIATYSSTSGIATYATTTGIATYASSSGIATYATNAGYATTSGISTTSQGLIGTPNITVGDIIATTASFSGNVSIAGTLTYEDVTNIDAIGLVTARSGVEVGPLSGIAATISSSGSAIFSGIVTASSFSGDLTGNANTATYAVVSGVSTYSTTAGIATYSTTSGVSTSVSGGTANVTSITLPDGLISTGSSTLTTIAETSIDTFSTSSYRSAKYQLQITRGSEYQITEVFIVHDGSSSYGTEYATVKTGSTLSSFSTDIDSGSVRLLVTPTTTASTTFKLLRTLVEV